LKKLNKMADGKTAGVTITVEIEGDALDFRAYVDDARNNDKYEVIVGGRWWTRGVGQEFRKEILMKCKELVLDLTKNIDKF